MGRGTISDDSVPWHLAGGCPAGSKTSTVDAPSSLVGFGGGPPLDDLDVVAVGIGHGADQAECLLLDLANPAHAEALEVRLEVAAVVYVEVDDHAGRLLRGAAHLAVRLDEEAQGADLEVDVAVLRQIVRASCRRRVWMYR